MISGTVSASGIPTIHLPVAGRNWPATIDTGFNGDLELPEELRPHVNPRPMTIGTSNLAGGKKVSEEWFLVDFPFDGQTMAAAATFITGRRLLLGTYLMRHHRLEIDFPSRQVTLTRRP